MSQLHWPSASVAEANGYFLLISYENDPRRMCFLQLYVAESSFGRKGGGEEEESLPRGSRKLLTQVVEAGCGGSLPFQLTRSGDIYTLGNPREAVFFLDQAVSTHSAHPWNLKKDWVPSWSTVGIILVTPFSLGTGENFFPHCQIGQGMGFSLSPQQVWERGLKCNIIMEGIC